MVTRDIAHRRPASSVISTSQIQVDRPRWRGRASAWTPPERIGRMKLVRAQQAIGRNAHLRGHPPAILRDILRIVVRAQPAIEAGVDALGHPALAREEGMPQAGNGRKQR